MEESRIFVGSNGRSYKWTVKIVDLGFVPVSTKNKDYTSLIDKLTNETATTENRSEINKFLMPFGQVFPPAPYK